MDREIAFLLKTEKAWLSCCAVKETLKTVSVLPATRSGSFLLLASGLIFLAAADVAGAECAEQNMQIEPLEVRVLTRAELRNEFRDFVSREFPVGSDGARLLDWLERSDFSKPRKTFQTVLSIDGMTEEADRLLAEERERKRKGKPLQFATRSFNTICGRQILMVAWSFDKCHRISELFLDEEPCRLDIP